jgi:hypothetical protein
LGGVRDWEDLRISGQGQSLQKDPLSISDWVWWCVCHPSCVWKHRRIEVQAGLNIKGDLTLKITKAGRVAQMIRVPA